MVAEELKIDSNTDIEFYKDNFNFKVYAGPGAGKTHFLIRNIKSIVENSYKMHNSTRRILCITYTNVAVNEIVRRLGNYRSHVYVSTIHSFLYENVIKPYQRQLIDIINSTFECNIPQNKKLYPRAEGFGLLAKIKASDFYAYLQQKYNIYVANLVTYSKLSDCVIDLKKMQSLNCLKYDLKDVLKSISKVPTDDWIKIKKAIWEKEGVLDFDEILYFSYLLLRKYKFISYDLAFKFPYIFIDEYQDTNPIQNLIIKFIYEYKNVSIGVVGDMAQSIYSFQGANYKEFLNLSIDTKEMRTYIIEGNRRSNENIVNFLNYMRQEDSTLKKQYAINNNSNSKVKFIVTNKEFIDVSSKFNNCVILCRKWIDALKYIHQISNEQNELLQNVHNFYKYKAARDLIKDFDDDEINWISQINLLVRIKESIDSGNFAIIIDEINKLFSVPLFDKTSNKHNTEQLKDIKTLINIFNTFDQESTYYNMISSIINNKSNINLASEMQLELPEEGDENFHKEFHPYLYKLEFKTLQIMVNEIFTDDSKYMTIHKTKGKEYDSLFVDISPSSSESLYYNSIIDIILNPNILNDKTISMENEITRIAYVAFSRAKENLYINIYIGDNEVYKRYKWRKAIQKMDEYISSNNIEKFYEIINI